MQLQGDLLERMALVEAMVAETVDLAVQEVVAMGVAVGPWAPLLHLEIGDEVRGPAPMEVEVEAEAATVVEEVVTRGLNRSLHPAPPSYHGRLHVNGLFSPLQAAQSTPTRALLCST